MRNYIELIRLHKPIPILLFLWPNLWILFLSKDNQIDYSLLIAIIVSTILVRSLGCIINDIVDKTIDRKVKRTKYRPLASAALSVKSAYFLLLLFSIACLLIYIRFFKSIYLAFIILLLISAYPFCKRFILIPQIFLGITANMGVIVLYVSSNHIEIYPTILIYISSIFWTISYDTIYSIQDRQCYIVLGLKSASTFLKKNRYISSFIFVLQTLTLIFLLFLKQNSLNNFFFFGIAISFLTFYYQYTLFKGGEPEKCNKAFLNNHWIGMIIFLSIIVSR